MRGLARRAGAVLALTLLLGGQSARATLGEPAASVDHDRQALAMERQPASARAGFSVHALRTSTVTVREFVGPDGAVFAVAWDGLTRPDLTALLGAYHDEYQRAAAQPRSGRGPRRIETGRLVVESWGHARHLHGRAYLPARLPAWVSADDLQ